MTQDLGAPEGPPQVPPAETDLNVAKQPVQASGTEGSPPKEPRTTQEHLNDPVFQALLLERYIKARQGGKGGMVAPNEISMADLEEETLSEMEADEKAQSEQKAKEEEFRMQAEIAGIPEEEKERKVLNEKIKHAIYGDSRSENRRHRVSLTGLAEHMPDKDQYQKLFKGSTDASNFPPSIFGFYAFQITYEPVNTDIRNMRAPALADVKSFADRLSLLRNESEKDLPDYERIDSLYSEFLGERIEHFFATIHQRVVRNAESAHGYHEREMVDSEFGPPSLSSFVEEINQRISKEKPRLDRLHNNAKGIMQGSGPKSSRLAIIGAEISDLMFYHLHYESSRVFGHDTFSTNPDEQKRLVEHEQLTLKYRAQQKSKAQAT